VRAQSAQDWAVFRHSFVMADGRVVDSPASTSHSRSQGIAMLGAVAADDRNAFSHILSWTEANLATRGDDLFACEWLPEAGVVAPPRDCADGDILIAWALLSAQSKWHADTFREDALRTLAAIRKRLLNQRGGYLLLLPGTEGYTSFHSTTINVADWIFPAFAAFDAADHAPQWRQLIADNAKLLEQARFGSTKLPTDWIDVDDHGAVSLASGRPPHFGLDAMQVPLFIAWGLKGDSRLPQLLEPFLKRWEHDTGAIAPQWIDVSTNAIAPTLAGPGLDAVLAAARGAVGSAGQTMPAITPKLDFPTASLILLGQVSTTSQAP
jgi:endoglucanase